MQHKSTTTKIGDNVGTTGERIKSFIQRVERVEQEIVSLQEDRKEIYAEAKSLGFDVHAIKHIVKMRKESEDKRLEREATLELYISALGDFFHTPLGKAGIP